MAKLDLSPLDDLFAKGENFKLTDAQKAKENGFIIASVITQAKEEK